MTKDKARKGAVRARMAKTGERYATARHYLLDQHLPPRRKPTPNPNPNPIWNRPRCGRAPPSPA